MIVIFRVLLDAICLCKWVYNMMVTLNEYQSESVGQAVAKSDKVTEGVTVKA